MNSFLRLCRFIFLNLIIVLPVTSVAADDVLDRLRAFTMDTRALSADFQQSLYNADAQLVKSDEGLLLLKRPGKFIWRYLGAEAQEFISDGKSLWMYDKDLEQVSVNALDDRLRGTPLVLLMGGAPLEEQFTVTALGGNEGVDWVELVPKDGGNDFEALFVGLNDKGLAAMELRDNLGQATQIQFTNVQSGVELDDAQFNFVAPKGVDVIGEPVQ